MKETCNLLIENARKFLDPASLFQVCIMKGFLSMQRLGLGTIHYLRGQDEGGRGSKNIRFCPRSGYKNCPRLGGGQEMAKFCPRSC